MDDHANAEPTFARQIARDAVRSQLAHSTVQTVLERGYDAITVTELATAAGVSRSTFLRYLGSKDVAVLEALLLERGRVADELRARPAAESPWTALRRAFDVIIDRGDPDVGKALRRLVAETPSLTSANLERQAQWCRELASALSTRNNGMTDAIAVEVVVSSAIGCLAIAYDHWAASDSDRPVADYLDEAFRAVAEIKIVGSLC